MKKHLVLALISFALTANAHAFSPLLHNLHVELVPLTQFIKVDDEIAVPDGTATIEFLLNGEFVVDAPASEIPLASNAELATIAKQTSVKVKAYRLPLNGNTAKVRYHGRLTLNQSEQEDIPGLMTANSIYLAASAVWYPLVNDNLLNFELTTTLPADWEVISQGKRSAINNDGKTKTIRWQESLPQDDIYLIAGPYTLIQSTKNNISAFVYLLQNDAAIAQTYLDATHRYIELYSRLLGPYPYAKFAMVENSWETGFGMPSFTLLGSRVLRMPFIINSSYPHEILHNWWGNSVYVDYSSGNWSEGLTAYLADHLFKEQRGEGASYRRDVLQKYADFTTANSDFALTEFVWRHNTQAEAVGYGKTLMLFHMLRRRLGDELFKMALREFYARNRFQRTSFHDVEKIFSEVSKQDLHTFFQQWITKPGAPELSITLAKAERTRGGYRVTLTLAQSTGPYELDLPVAIRLEKSATTHSAVVHLASKSDRFTIDVPEKPLAIAVDPEYDTFRRMDVSEIPAALSQGFGAEKNSLILASNSANEAEYTKLFETWRNNLELQIDAAPTTALADLQTAGTIWFAGWDSRYADVIIGQLEQQGIRFYADSVTIKDKTYSRKQHSFIFCLRNPNLPRQTFVWIATENIATLPALARKLPHYGKYSYLVFEGAEATNVDKGQWPTQSTALFRSLDRTLDRTQMNFPPRAALEEAK